MGTPPGVTSVWTATGEAIDNDLLCSAATGVLEGFEDEDGVTRTSEEYDALPRREEPYAFVTVELMTCDDGSGEFTLRSFNEIDRKSDREDDRTWTITGVSGYDTTYGDGGVNEVSEAGNDFISNGTGAITKD